MNIFADRINHLGTETAFKMGDNIRQSEAQGLSVIKLNLGEPDFETPGPIVRKAIEELKNGNTHYTDPQGIPSLRECIARQVSATRGVDVEPSRIVVTAGAKPPISYTMMAYVNPGDEVIYPSPGFPIYESWTTFVGAVPVPLHLEEKKNFRFDAEDLARLITPKTRILVINSPSNPTGGVLTENDLSEIARVLREKAPPGMRIFSDEIYEDIIFDGKTHCSIMSMPGMRNRTIMVSGHSKSYAMTGWRLGYAVMPSDEEALVFRQLNINIFSCIPPFIQEAARAAFENADTRSIVGRMVAEFEKRRDVVVKGLNAIDGIHCINPEGAFYVFPRIDGVCESLGILTAYESLPPEIKVETTPSTLFQMFLLYSHGVASLDRKSFGTLGSEGKHFLRLSTATDMASLQEGLKRIETASRDRDGFKTFFTKGEHLF